MNIWSVGSSSICRAKTNSKQARVSAIHYRFRIQRLCNNTVLGKYLMDKLLIVLTT